ncbi:MAG: hypothetical protein U0744_20485 [Gemmataceae bacterium]
MAEWIAHLRSPRVISIGTPPRKDQKLDAKEATIRIEAAFGSETATITIGSRFIDFQRLRAQSTAWPGGIFLVPDMTGKPAPRPQP